MANSVLCTICCKWIHARCTKIRKVTACLARDFVCKNCKDKKEMKEPVELLCDGVETVTEFSYLGDGLNATGGCEVAVTARTRIGRIKFRECGSKRFSLKLKGKVYKSCVRSAMMHGSET